MSCVTKWRAHVNSDTWADIVTELHLKQNAVMQQHLTNIIFWIFLSDRVDQGILWNYSEQAGFLISAKYTRN